MVRTGQRILAVLLPDHKVKLGLAWASILAVLCVALSVAISMFGMRGFDMILGNNARSLSFWSAMDQERTTFSRYIQSGTQEAREEYQEASEKTRRELAKLSFDYKKIGADCYARTWSIKSLYENYVPERDLVLMMDQQESGYRERLSRVYRLQGYLTTYAGQLEQMTIQLGNRQYQSSRTMLVLVPVATLFLGILSLSLTWYISALREKHDMERQLADVQLQMLKNQIKPHFLFNTLNLIASMAQIEDAEVTEKMIEALSRLFRYNLKSSESVMPLERELRVVPGLHVSSADAFWKADSVSVGLCAGDSVSACAVVCASASRRECNQAWSVDAEQWRTDRCALMDGRRAVSDEYCGHRRGNERGAP